MTSKEVCQYIPEEDKPRDLSSSIDLTIFYGQHGTPADAERNSARIEPNSVVFLEGYSIGDGAEFRSRALQILRNAHVQVGVDSQVYQDIKAHVLTYMGMALDECAAQGETGFTLYNNTVIQRCVEKDCLIISADYRQITDSQDADIQTQLDEKHAELLRLLEARNTASDFMDITAGTAKGQHVQQAYDYHDHNIAIHGIRERFTTATIIGSVNEFMQLPDLKDVNTLPDGRLKGYLSYGAGHRYSLTTRLNEAGVDTTIVEIKEPPEWVCLDKDKASTAANRSRKVAHKAILSLIDDYYITDEWEQAMRDATYRSLEYLNGDDTATVEFLVRCLAIRQRQAAEPDEARQQYLSLMREFMPDPQRFVDRAIELPAVA